MKRYVSTMIAAAMVLGCVTAARADVIITLKSENLKTHRTQLIRLYAKNNRIAYRRKDGAGMIFDGDRQVSWNYDTRHGVYVEMTAENARQIAKRSRAIAARMDETLRDRTKQLPAERRKRMRKNLSVLREAPHFKRLGPEERVGQWRCTPIAKVDDAGKQEERMCVAPFKELGIEPRDQKVFESMDRFVAMMGPDHVSAHSRFTLQAEDELGLHGIAVRDRYGNIATKVVAVRHGKVSDDLFRLPKGLQKISLLKP